MNRKNANPSTELEERLRVETLLVDVSSKFVDLPAGEVDREIMDAQLCICEFLELDILVLWQVIDDAAGILSATHRYSVQQGRQPAVRLHEDDYPWFKRQLMAGRMVDFASLDERPKEAVRDRNPSANTAINANAFSGGFRMREPWTERAPQAFQAPRDDQAKKAKGSRK